ncbi:MAG: antibiotic biosynthesis monooxygenase [Sneathiella sp.]|uniref:antibiotic biosynthesis monooxygenase n=1 Tax=Sneathiella sp. TaxID=1964365 RepID=UPI0030020841
MKPFGLTCVALCLLTAPAFALDRELEDLNRTVFQSVDLNKDGLLSLREVDLFRQDVMISQDYDDDGTVTAEEYLGWDMGWNHLAETRGVADQYWQARQHVFDAWDTNHDGVLDTEEQALSQSKDFYTAANQSNTPLNFEAFKSNLRIMAEMNKAVNTNTEVTLINVFEVPEGALEETITMWAKGRDFLQTQPGYVSTALHQSVAPDAKFALINIAIWESVETFQAATAAMRARGTLPQIEGLAFTPGLYKIIARD